MADMYPPFATSYDVSAVWGELTIEEEQRVTEWLKTASNNLRLIGRRRGVNVDDYICGNPILEQAAKDAVVEAVRRRLMNPKGLRQTSVTMGAGPYSETQSSTIDSSISSGGLGFADADLLWLPAAQRNRIRSFRVRSGFRQ